MRYDARTLNYAVSTDGFGIGNSPLVDITTRGLVSDTTVWEPALIAISDQLISLYNQSSLTRLPSKVAEPDHGWSHTPMNNSNLQVQVVNGGDYQ